MNTKINRFALIFLILMIAIPMFSFNVGATETTITESCATEQGFTKGITVRSDGVMFAFIWDDASPIKMYLYSSSNNGVNWTNEQSLTTSQSTSYSSCIGVDDNDDIHIFYVNNNDIFHRVWYSNDTLSDSEYIEDNVVTTEHYGFDVAFDSENMYFVWAEHCTGSVAYLRYRAYNFALETWGTMVTLESFSSAVYMLKPSIVKYGNDLFVFYEDRTDEDGVFYAHYHASNTSWTKEHELAKSSTYAYHRPKAVNYDGDIFICYYGNTSADPTHETLFYKTYDGTLSSQNVIHSDIGYDQREPTLSVNSDGTLNVVWSGKSILSSTYFQLRQKTLHGGTWSATAFISGGATVKRYSDLLYQDYPTFTWLTSDVSIVYSDDSYDDFEYIDSGSLIWYAGEEGEYAGEFEFDANNNIGNLDTGCTLDISRKTIEFKYQVPTTINATGFDLLVSPTMHSVSQDLSNYDLYINGESLGHPTEWKAYSNKWVLRWTFTEEKVITNSEILYEVYHGQLISGINYWSVGVSCGYNDLDGDGIASMRYGNTYPNGAYDGIWLAKDVAYQIYFNIIQFVEDETDVTYNSISAVNTTYYVGESVPLTYTIKSSDLVYDNYVRIWNDDTTTEITAGTMQGFPYLCTHQVETIGFVPFTSANYTAHLYINDVETDNVSFYPQDHINSEMYVFTYPNPSKATQKVWVSYKFNHPTNKSGAIFLSLTPNLNSYISVNYLSDGDTGFWTTSHDTVGTYYYIMAVDINGNGTYGIVNNGVHPHTVISEHGNNYFTLGEYNLRLNEEGTVTQIVNGECNMVSGNCYIYDNNQLVKTITESPFSYNYEIHTAGLHTVEMRLITNVTTVLCVQNYTVTTYTGDDEIEQVEDSGDIVRDYIYDNWGDFGIFIAGVCIILGFMFIPFGLVLAVNVKYNKNIALGDLHWSIYLIFAIVGVIVVVQLHLADLWIILLICVVTIAITVITYNNNK